jgi:DNA mismatch repair protein MutS
MQQWRDAKERHPGMLLLFRLGDFLELFGSDAEIAAKTLGLTLTTRREKDCEPVPMAGFPKHCLESYLHRLLQAGHRVAICEYDAEQQSEQPNLFDGL